MAKVLVTGGAGFIGSHLVEALVERGDRVRVLDNFSSGKAENLADVKDEIELREGDICKRDDLQSALDGMQIVFHQAAMVSVPESIENPEKCFASNVQAVIDLLALAKEEGVGTLVLASSTAVYGAQERIPLREDISVETLSPYAASKHFNESLARVYSNNYGLSAVALRYFNVFGQRQSPESDYAAVIPKFVESLRKNQAPLVYGDGTQTRDFIYIGDVVRANLRAAASNDAAGKVFNICSGKESSLLDLLDILYEFYPAAPRPKFAEARLGDVARSVGDPTFAEKELGFRAQTSLKEGLSHLLKAAD